MDLETIEKNFNSAQVFLDTPDVYMGKAQSLLESLLKLNYLKSAGVEWISEYGDISVLVNSLWSDVDEDILDYVHKARKIRNKFAHEGVIDEGDANLYNVVVGWYIDYLEDGQLQTYPTGSTSSISVGRKAEKEELVYNAIVRDWIPQSESDRLWLGHLKASESHQHSIVPKGCVVSIIVFVVVLLLILFVFGRNEVYLR